MEGYVKIHRQITKNEYWLSERFTKSQAWIDLLLLATYKKRTVFIRGVEINLSPGELCYSQKTLSDRWKWNERTVNRYLTSLKKREMIQCRITNVTTIISILNWKIYQVDTEQTTDQNTEQSKTRIHTNNKGNKDNNIKSISIKFIPENLNGNLFYKNEYFFITRQYAEELLQAFNNKNFTEESLKNSFYAMKVWLDENGSKKKYKSFIANWLKKEPALKAETKQTQEIKLI